MTSAPWHIGEFEGATLARSLEIDADSWEAAIGQAWRRWALPHDLDQVGIETSARGVTVFIRGSSTRYRVQTAAQAAETRAASIPPAKPRRAVPRPAPTRPPPAPVPAEAAPPAEPNPVATMPRTPAVPFASDSSARGLTGRGLFRKLPRPSAPDLEEAAGSGAVPAAPAATLATPSPIPAAPAEQPLPELSPASLRPPALPSDLVPPPPAEPPPELPQGSEPPSSLDPLDAFAASPSSPPAPRKIGTRALQRLMAGAVLLYTHEQDPKSGAPVVYRRHGYALPMGTEEHEAEAFAREMLLRMQEQVPRGRAPRLFHLAVYDEMFTGEPEILALCKLEWKEWKSETNVSFPRQGDDSVITVAPRARTPSMHPPDYTTPLQPISSTDAARVAALFLPSATVPNLPKRGNDDES